MREKYNNEIRVSYFSIFLSEAEKVKTIEDRIKNKIRIKL